LLVRRNVHLKGKNSRFYLSDDFFFEMLQCLILSDRNYFFGEISGTYSILRRSL